MAMGTMLDDGYPADETLQRIREWPVTDLRGLFEFVREAWNWPTQLWTETDAAIICCAGGWSGNEDLIGALKANAAAWTLTWYQSTRGGRFEFRLPVSATPQSGQTVAKKFDS
jgi:hypothetical protein